MSVLSFYLFPLYDLVHHTENPQFVPFNEHVERCSYFKQKVYKFTCSLEYLFPLYNLVPHTENPLFVSFNIKVKYKL